MEPFKNLFNPVLVKNLGLAIHRSYSKFDNKSFLEQTGPELASLELKERVIFIANRLYSIDDENLDIMLT